jgi:hypothetical protein
VHVVGPAAHVLRLAAHVVGSPTHVLRYIRSGTPARPIPAQHPGKGPSAYSDVLVGWDCLPDVGVSLVRRVWCLSVDSVERIQVGGISVVD